MPRDRKYEPVALGQDEADYEDYRDKEPTTKQDHLSAWLLDKTGLTFSTKKEEAAFADGVRLTVSLHKHYQRSPENHERHEAEQEARAAGADDRKAVAEEKRALRVAARAERDAEKAARRPSEPDTNGAAAPKRRGRPARPVAEDEPVPTPKRRGRPPRAAAPAAEPEAAPKRRGRPAATASAPVSPGEGGTRRPPRRRATAGAGAGI